MTFKRTTSDDPDFAGLVANLDRILAVTDGDDHSFFAQFNKSETLIHCLVAYDGTAIGCGALRVYDQDTVEVKRMFVLPEFRGRSVGREILSELEKWAFSLGYKNCILETAKTLEPAVALYRSSGYEIIENYPPYDGVETSVCLTKKLYS